MTWTLTVQASIFNLSSEPLKINFDFESVLA